MECAVLERDLDLGRDADAVLAALKVQLRTVFRAAIDSGVHAYKVDRVVRDFVRPAIEAEYPVGDVDGLARLNVMQLG